MASDVQQRRFWDEQAGRYDRSMRFVERRFLRDTRDWVCRQASGHVLEVALGTGLNLPWYRPQTRITGLELSSEMLQIARHRARNARLDAELIQGSAQQLPFADNSFDTVLCTLSLCSIPDDHRGISEMVRVLKPGQKLILADHVESSAAPVRLLQRMLDWWTVPREGEHFRRRPIHFVRQSGLAVEHHERFLFGVIERFVATKPETRPGPDVLGSRSTV